MKIITCGPSKYEMDHPESTNLLNQTLLFVCFDSLHPNQYFFSHVGMGLPMLNQYSRGINVFCSRTKHSAAYEAQIRIPSILSQALYHCTPFKTWCKISLVYNRLTNRPITTKVICFSHLLKCLRSLYGKQCGPRSDCSYRSSLFWVHAVCF